MLYYCDHDFFDYYLNFNEIIKNNFNETIIQYILYNKMSFELF